MTKRTLVVVSISVVIALSFVSGVHAAEFKLTPSDGEADDEFGYSVAIAGGYALFGAHYDDSGSAYIFKWNGISWFEQAKLTASDAAAGDGFGHSVAIAGDYALIGAYGNDDNGSMSGSAYIFKRDGSSWNEQAKLTASDAAASDRFGSSVAIAGEYALVGAHGNADNGTDSGSAYIFKWNGISWFEQAKLTASDTAAYDHFGLSVAIAGDYALVGAPYDNDNGIDSGSTYIFKRDGSSWTQQAKLTASDGEADDRFGESVAIAGEYALISAFADDDHGTNSGSAYI
ncbi:MAG: FG-GAP repeat protein [Candidatus Methanospirareceae archaeon]